MDVSVLGGMLGTVLLEGPGVYRFVSSSASVVLELEPPLPNNPPAVFISASGAGCDDPNSLALTG